MSQLTIRFRAPKLIKLSLGLMLLMTLLPATNLALPKTSNPLRITAAAQPVPVIVTECTTNGGFFGLEPWYAYLGKEFKYSSGASSGPDDKCDVKCFNLLTIPNGGKNQCGQGNSDVPLVLLAVIDDLLRIVGIAAVGFVIYGGFQYTTSQGSPDATSRAQSTIINALIGMALAMVSILVVSYLGNTFGS